MALRALAKLDYIPFIKNVGTTVKSSGDMKLVFEFVDLLDAPSSSVELANV